MEEFKPENISPIIQPPEPEKNWFSRYKIVLFSLLLLFLVGLVGGLYFWKYTKSISIQPENTSEKLASNATTPPITPKDFGFIIASSTDWKVQTIDSGEPYIVQTFKYTSSDGIKSFTVSIFGNVDPATTTMHDWAKSDAIKYDPQAKEDTKSFKVGSNLGSIYTGEVNGKLYKREYLIRGIEKQIYRINVEMDKNNSWMPDFDKMISTFSFIALNVDSYKVYNNVQFAFELTYPSNWRTEDRSDGVELRNYFNPILDLPTNPRDITVSVMQNKNPNKLSMTDWLAKNAFWTDSSKYKNFITINGYEAVKIYYERPNASYPGVINKGYTYLIARDKDIILSGYSSKDGSPDFVLDKIITSIKFTAFDSKTYSAIINSETQSIIGQDSDHNGVWDYVDTWINTNYPNSPNIQSSLRMMAKSMQFEMLNYRDKNAVVQESQQDHSVDCLFKADPKGSGQLITTFEGVVANTSARFKAYLSANGQMSGQFYGSPTDAELTKICGF